MPQQYDPGTFYFADGSVDPYPYANIANKPPSYKGGQPQFTGRMEPDKFEMLKDVLGLFGFSKPKKQPGGMGTPQPLGAGGAAMQTALRTQPSWLITQ